MECPTLINWSDPFRIWVLMDSSLQFHLNSKSTFSKQKVQHLISGVWSGSALFAAAQ